MYIGAVLAATVPVLGLAILRISQSETDAGTLMGVGVFLCLAFLADLKPVPLDERGDRPISLAFIFILASQILFGWHYAVLIAAVSVLVPQVIERRPPSRMLFNTGVYVLATIASAFPRAVPLGRRRTPAGPIDDLDVPRRRRLRRRQLRARLPRDRVPHRHRRSGRCSSTTCGTAGPRS